MTRSQTVAVIGGAATAFALIIIALVLVGILFRASRHQATRTPIQCNLSNRVEIPNHPALQFRRGAFTISMWFRTTTQRKYIAFMGKRINGLGDGWALGANDQNSLSFYTAGCASPASRPQNFRDGQWHHLIALRRDQTMTFYYDGQDIGSGPDTCDHNEVHPLRIGMDADGCWHFEGEIAEVHFYDHAFSDTEVALEWNNGKGRKTVPPGGGLIAGYHFDETAGGQGLDFSGNGHHGTMIRSSVAAAGQN